MVSLTLQLDNRFFPLLTSLLRNVTLFLKLFDFEHFRSLLEPIQPALNSRLTT